MSSLTRRIQRRILRKRADYEGAPQPTVVHADGSYKTLRPTRGWLEMSLIRIIAQRKLAEILQRAFVPVARARKSPKVWRSPVPLPPSTETRQQRRHQSRKGLR